MQNKEAFMYSSFTRLKITPPPGLPLAGNAREDSAARGVHDDLYANIAYVESGGKRVLFVGLDLIGVLGEDCGAVKNGIHTATGLTEDEVVIFATHTHSGPDVVGVFGSFLTAEDIKNCEGYRRGLVEKIVNAVPDLLKNKKTSRMGFTRERIENCSFNRRIRLKNGATKMVFEEYEPADIECLLGPNGWPWMSVFAFDDGNGRICGVILQFTSHPAIVCGTDWLYSRDYIDALTNGIKRRYGEDVTVVFANGAQGNLVAADPYKPFITGFEEAERVGDILADGAIRALTRLINDDAFNDSIPIKTAISSVTLPIRQITEKDIAYANELTERAKHTGVQLHGLDPRVEAESIMEMADYPFTEETAAIQAIVLGEARIATFPGEVFFEYAQQVLAGYEETGLVVGLANGYIGYIPTRAAFGEGGYEIKTSRNSSRFAPEAGEILAARARELLVSIS